MRRDFLAVFCVVRVALLCASAFADPHLAPYRDGKVLVRFKAGARAAALGRYERSAGIKMRRSIGDGWIQEMVLPAGMTVSQALSLYNTDPDIEFAEPPPAVGTPTCRSSRRPPRFVESLNR